jgi:hypothetical protein
MKSICTPRKSTPKPPECSHRIHTFIIVMHDSRFCLSGPTPFLIANESRAAANQHHHGEGCDKHSIACSPYKKE